MIKKRCLIRCFLVGGVFFSPISVHAISITVTSDALALAQTIVGPGITIVGTPTLTAGNSAQAALYDSSNIGAGSGVVLSTGDTNNIPGIQSNFLSTNYGAAGDLDVASIPGQGSQPCSASSMPIGPCTDPVGPTTNDAVILEFDFNSRSGSAFIELLMATDDTPFDFGGDGININDIASHGANDGLFISIDGSPNLALLSSGNPATSQQIFVDWLPFGGGVAVNPFGYSQIADTGFDEHTGLFTGGLALNPGVTHHIKIAIADGTDGIADSALFLPSGVLSSPVPIPAAVWLFGSGLGLLGWFRRKAA